MLTGAREEYYERKKKQQLRMTVATFLCRGGVGDDRTGVTGRRASANPIIMKLSTATLNDTQHEWLKRFAAAVEKDSGGRIKGEVYPASQLGSIPRQIEGTQFGSIQGWVGPPEFLVGVDERYEVLSAPGLFASREQYLRVINDPAVRDLVLGLGANKGLLGAGIFPIGPSSIITKKPIHSLADYAGLKIRVLASPVPAGADQAHGRLAGGDDLGRRLAGAATRRHRRLAHHDHAIHDACTISTRQNMSWKPVSPTSARSRS